MEPSALHSQIAVFEAEDNSLYFALGLARAADKIHQALASQTGSAWEQDSDDDLVYFILGIESFFSNYLKALARFDAGLPQESDAHMASTYQPLTRLAIRDLLV